MYSVVVISVTSYTITSHFCIYVSLHGCKCISSFTQLILMVESSLCKQRGEQKAVFLVVSVKRLLFSNAPSSRKYDLVSVSKNNFFQIVCFTFLAHTVWTECLNSLVTQLTDTKFGTYFDFEPFEQFS